MIETVPRLWSRDEYHRAGEARIFRPDERLELLNGEVYEKMSPQSDAHAWGVSLTSQVLREAFGNGCHVREEKPIVLSPRNEPEPDVAVVQGELRQSPLHPTPLSLALVVEVSDSSLEFDRGTKAHIYAGAGIAEFWILNLRDRKLEVRRDPFVTSAGVSDYRLVSFYSANERLFPLEPVAAEIEVRNLLPFIV